MACRLAGAKPLSEPILEYCQLDPWEQTSVKYQSKFIHFHSRKCIWNVVWKMAAILPRPQWVNSAQPWVLPRCLHYSDTIMSAMASQITSLTIVYSTFYSGADQRKLQSTASLAFVRRIHRWQLNSPRERPVMRKMFLFDDVIMCHISERYDQCMLCNYFETTSAAIKTPKHKVYNFVKVFMRSIDVSSENYNV